MPAMIYGSVDLTAYPYVLEPDADLSVGQAVTVAVERLLTDGEVVSGIRTANRQPVIPFAIQAASRDELAAAEVAVAQQADLPSNTLTVSFGSGGGRLMVADTFRGQLTPVFSDAEDDVFIRRYELTFQALPFLRTPDLVSLAPGGAGVQLDAMDTLSGRTSTGSPSLNTTTKYEGSGSLQFTLGNALGTGTRSLSTSLAVSADLSALPYVTFQALADFAGPEYFAAAVWSLQLVSAGGSKTWSMSAVPNGRGFAPLTVDTTTAPVATSGTLNLAAVTSYVLTFTYTTNVTSYQPRLYLDDLRAQSGIGAQLATPQAVVRFTGIPGAARTPAGFTFAVNSSSTVSRLMLSSSPGAPSGFQPILAVSAATTHATLTSDLQALCGSWTDTATWVSAAQNYSGTYTVWARVKQVAAGAVSLSLSARITGDATANAQTAARIVFSTGELSTSSYAMVPVGPLTLPTRGVSPTNTATTLTFTLSSGNLQVDSLYLVDMDGEFLLVDATTGFKYWKVTPPPDAATGYGDVLAGTASGYSDATSMATWLRSNTVFHLHPGDQAVMIVADRALTGAAVTAWFYPRYLAERPS